MSLVNLKQTAAEVKEETSPVTAEQPAYPYGLCIDLNDDTMKKLGLTEAPKPGTVLKIEALATVSRASSYQEMNGEADQSMGLQITDMALTPASGPSLEERAASSLYGKA